MMGKNVQALAGALGLSSGLAGRIVRGADRFAGARFNGARRSALAPGAIFRYHTLCDMADPLYVAVAIGHYGLIAAVAHALADSANPAACERKSRARLLRKRLPGARASSHSCQLHAMMHESYAAVKQCLYFASISPRLSRRSRKSAHACSSSRSSHGLSFSNTRLIVDWWTFTCWAMSVCDHLPPIRLRMLCLRAW